MNTGANGFMFVTLDSETKKNLEEFQKIHNSHKEKYKNQQVNFRDLIIDLGNFYVSKRIELMKSLVDEELSQKLEKLEIAFKIYNEEKIVGEIKDVGSMANEVHFTLVVAKSDRYIKEAIEAVKNGKSAKSAVKRDITANDKETVSNILIQAKKILILVIEYYNKKNTLITENNTKDLNDFIVKEIKDNDWTFDKLMLTFELLDKTKGVKEDRYTYEKFMSVIESSEITHLFTKEEINVLVELYNIYNC